MIPNTVTVRFPHRAASLQHTEYSICRVRRGAGRRWRFWHATHHRRARDREARRKHSHDLSRSFVRAFVLLFPHR